MKLILNILSLCIIAGMIGCKSNNTNQINLESIRSESLCILEETNEHIKYLTKIERIIERSKNEQELSADDNELFLRYEIWTIMKKDKNLSNQESGMLHCIPERIATEAGESYDDAAIYLSREIADNDGNLLSGNVKGSNEWTSVGLYSENGIYSKICNFFDENENKIPVVQEYFVNSIKE